MLTCQEWHLSREDQIAEEAVGEREEIGLYWLGTNWGLRARPETRNEDRGLRTWRDKRWCQLSILVPLGKTSIQRAKQKQTVKQEQQKTSYKIRQQNHGLTNAKLPSPKYRIFKVNYWLSLSSSGLACNGDRSQADHYRDLIWQQYMWRNPERL